MSALKTMTDELTYIIDGRIMQDDATIEEWNELIKNYMIDFIDDFTSAGDKGMNVALRKTNFESEASAIMQKLSIELTTNAEKMQDGLISHMSFRIVQKRKKLM